MDFVEALSEGTPSFLYKIRAPDPLGVIGGGIYIIRIHTYDAYIYNTSYLYTYINTYARTFESMLLIVFSRPHGSAKNIMWWWVVALTVYHCQYHLLKHIYRDT